MSAPAPQDPRHEPSSLPDDELIAAHDQAAGGEPDKHAHYRLLPLAMLFIFSGLIFYAGAYLNRYAGLYHGDIFDERVLPTDGQPVAAAIDPVVLGRRQYALACVTCHMPNGQGIPNLYPPLVGTEWVVGSEERLVAILVHGLKGPVTVNGNVYSAAAMPAFGQVAGSGYNWSDERIAAVLTYIRQEWGNAAGPISTEQVREFRTRIGNRAEWTEPELLAMP